MVQPQVASATCQTASSALIQKASVEGLSQLIPFQAVTRGTCPTSTRVSSQLKLRTYQNLLEAWPRTKLLANIMCLLMLRT